MYRAIHMHKIIYIDILIKLVNAVRRTYMYINITAMLLI